MSCIANLKFKKYEKLGWIKEILTNNDEDGELEERNLK